MRWLSLVAAILLWNVLAYAEVQECLPVSASPDGKIVCGPAKSGGAGSSAGSKTPASSNQRQVFTGRVVKVFDNRAMEIEAQGKFARVRIYTKIPWETSKEDLAVVVLHRDVAVYVRNIESDGTVFADVMIAKDTLGDLLWKHTSNTPAAIQYRQQEAEKREKMKAEEQARQQARQEEDMHRKDKLLGDFQKSLDALKDAPYWNVREWADDMTDAHGCILVSQEKYISTTHKQLAAIHIVVQITRELGEIVSLVSGSSADKLSFHNDIHGLGMRIDTYPFAPVGTKASQGVLAFLPEQSKQLVAQLQTGQVAKFRVRFWPYDQNFDSEVSLRGFADEFEALKRCVAKRG